MAYPHSQLNPNFTVRSSSPAIDGGIMLTEAVNDMLPFDDSKALKA
jgi:hypothetical protein